MRCRERGRIMGLGSCFERGGDLDAPGWGIEHGCLDAVLSVRDVLYQ
jgi:hypothetical protein